MNKSRRSNSHHHQGQHPSEEKVRSVRANKMNVLFIAGAISGCVALLWIINSFSVPDRPDPNPLPKKLTEEELKSESLDVVRQLVDDFPRTHDSFGIMGSVHYQFGDMTEAVNCWERALELNPRFAQAYILMAKCSIYAGDYEKAVDQYRKALEIDPRIPNVYGLMGEALIELGRLKEGVAALETELDYHPNNIMMEFKLGKAYMQLRQHEEAIRHMERAHKKMPGQSFPCYILAKAYARVGQPEKAAEFHAKFIRFRAVEDEAGLSQIQKGANVLRSSEIAANTHTQAGQMCAQRGQQRLAEEHWSRAAFLDEEHLRCRELLVDTYMRRSRWAPALGVINELLEINPDNAAYHLNKGTTLYYLGKLADSEKSIRSSIRLAPQNPVGYSSLVQLLSAGNRNLHGAKLAAQKLVELQPTAQNYAMLSSLCRQTGDQAGAQAAMERSQQVLPRSR